MAKVRGISMTRAEVRQTLKALENQFGMTSKEFVRRYEAGELEHRTEFTRWAAFYAFLTEAVKTPA